MFVLEMSLKHQIVYIKIFILASAIIWIPNLAFTQINSIDYSQQQNSSYQNSSKKRDYQAPKVSYLDSAKYLAEKNPLRAIDFINKAIEKSIKDNDKPNESLAYLILGNIQQKLQQHDLAVENYRKCINVFNVRSKVKSFSVSSSNEPSVFNAHKQMAVSFIELNEFDKALRSLESCYNFSGMPVSSILSAKRVEALIKLKQNQFSESISILSDVLAQEKQQLNSKGQIETNIALGTVYLLQNNDNKAEELFNAAKEMAVTAGQPKLEIEANDLLAKIFRKQKNVLKELETRNSNIAINANANNTQAIVKQNIEIGNAYLNANQMNVAQTYFDKGLNSFATQGAINDGNKKIVINSNDLDETANTYKFLAEEYLKQKNLDKALSYFNIYAGLQDSIKNVRQRELDEAINLSNSLGKNQQRIDLLEKERQLSEKSLEVLKQDKDLKEGQLDFKNIIIGVLILFLILIVLGGYFIIKSSKEKRKVNQLLALKSLRGQMNPHFIFNALNSVNHYISQNDERKANRYLSDFSKLMRMVMDSSKHSLVPISEELEMLKLYLQLEHTRFNDKFDYTFTITDSITDSDFELPPMLIQPYIENAIWHGLRYLDCKGELILLFEELNHELVVTICDNGIGRNKSLELKTLNQKKQLSIGMQNIENRIVIMNDLFKTNIRVEVTDAHPNEVHCGTKVKLFIPQQT